MVNVSGTMTLNGITDPELVKILEVKIKHEKSFFFQPNQLQPQPAQGPNPNYYNNVYFNWNNVDGLEAAHEVISFLLNKAEKAQGQ
jgi:hypothetical protein